MNELSTEINLVELVPLDCKRLRKGTAGIRNIEKVYKKFSLPHEEEIIAYIKSPIPLIGPILVATNRALYSPAEKIIGYDVICGYVVALMGEEGALCAVNGEEKIELVCKRPIGKNMEGQEVGRYLRKLQNYILQCDPRLKKMRTDKMSSLFKRTKDEMRSGFISDVMKNVMDQLISEEEYTDKVQRLKAEEYFRSCDEDKYNEYKNKLNEQTKHEIAKHESEFYQEFLNDLKNSTLIIHDDFIKQAAKNLEKKKELLPKQIELLGYLIARQPDELKFDQVMKERISCLGKKTKMELAFFRYHYKNKRMGEVLTKIEHAELPEDTLLMWSDSLGLNPLHYAILLKKEQIIAQLIKNKKIKLLNNVNLELPMYDYTNLATLQGYQEAQMIFEATSDVIAELKHTLKVLEMQLWTKNKLLSVQSMTIASCEKAIRTVTDRPDVSYEKIESLREKMDRSNEVRVQIEEQVCELEEEIEDLKSEIKDVIQSAINEASVFEKDFYKNKDPFFQLFGKISKDPIRVLNEIHGEKLLYHEYTYENFRFAAAAKVHIDLPFVDENSDWSAYKTEDKKETEKYAAKNPVKPYGNSWFSAEAHANRKILKKEYHELAKEYHPDNSKFKYGKEIFQEILEERIIILEEMGD